MVDGDVRERPRPQCATVREIERTSERFGLGTISLVAEPLFTGYFHPFAQAHTLHARCCKSDYRHPFSNVLNYCCLADDEAQVDAIKKMYSVALKPPSTSTHIQTRYPNSGSAIPSIHKLLFPAENFHRTLFINSYFIARLIRHSAEVAVVTAINVRIMFSECQHIHEHAALIHPYSIVPTLPHSASYSLSSHLSVDLFCSHTHTHSLAHSCSTYISNSHFKV